MLVTCLGRLMHALYEQQKHLLRQAEMQSRAREGAEAEEEMHDVQRSAGTPSERASAAKARLEDIAAEVQAAQGRLDSLRE